MKMLKPTVIASEKLTVEEGDATWEDSVDWGQPQLVSKQWLDSELLYMAGLLAERFGESVVILTDANGDKTGDQSLASLIKRWFPPCAPKSENDIPDLGLVCHWSINQEVHKEIRLCQMPHHTQCLLDKFRQEWFPVWEWIILAPQQTCVSVHQDVMRTASWNILTSGRKLWAFWHPENSPPKQSNTKKFFEGILSEKVSPPPDIVLVQEVNDFVWIPSGWWHGVYYLQPCICITKNIVNLNNIKLILDTSENDDKSFHKLLSKIAEHQGLISS